MTRARLYLAALLMCAAFICVGCAKEVPVTKPVNTPLPTATPSPAPTPVPENPIKTMVNDFFVVAEPYRELLKTKADLDALAYEYGLQIERHLVHLQLLLQPAANLPYLEPGRFEGELFGPQPGVGSVYETETGYHFRYTMEDGSVLEGWLKDGRLFSQWLLEETLLGQASLLSDEEGWRSSALMPPLEADGLAVGPDQLIYAAQLAMAEEDGTPDWTSLMPERWPEQALIIENGRISTRNVAKGEKNE